MSEPNNKPVQNEPGNTSPALSDVIAAGNNEPLFPPPAQQERKPIPIIVKEKRGFWDYLSEFVLIIVAVVIGFFVDSARENWEDSKKEKEYMRSLIVDLKTDTAKVNQASDFIIEQVQNIETLQNLFSSDVRNNHDAIYQCYYLSTYLQLFWAVDFNQRTITQLLSSGNMRLVKSTGVADSVTQYFNSVKTVEAQRQVYINYMNKCLESMYDVYDIYYLRQEISGDSVKFIHSDWSNIQLLTYDPVELKKFVAILETTKSAAGKYLEFLVALRSESVRLLKFLMKKYNIKSPQEN